MFSTKQRLICLAVFAAMTTACSTSSGLNTGTANSSNIPGSGGTETPKEKFEKVDLEKSTVAKLNKESEGGSAEPAPEPEYGHTQPAAITGYIFYDEEKSRNDFFTKPARIDLEKAQIDKEENFNEITFTNYKDKPETESINIIPKHWTDNSQVEDYASSIEYSGDVSDETKKGVSYLYNTTTKDQLKLFALENTKIGMLMKVDDSGQFVNLFYKAQNPSEIVPSTGTATYEGLWDVMRDVAHQDFNTQKTSGYGEELKLAAATFTTNFKDKTITGELSPRKYEVLGQDRTFAYKLSGDIKGNRFSGTALATGESKDDLRDATFSGGFFGKQSSELAGTIQNTKDLEDTSKPGIFGVFAAKQSTKDNISVPEYNKSGAANFKDSVFVTKFEDVLDKTTKLPNVNTITLNGVEINLLKQADNVFTNNDENLPLQFTRIGAVQTDAKEPLYTYFYQGQLTQTMPTTGEAKYEGYWMGSGKAESGTPYSMSKASNAQLNFTANFADKTLAGQFLTPAGNEAMTLQGVEIQGNTFAGTANIVAGGLTNDKDGSQGRIKGSVNLSGGFFGDDANELGGQFNKEDNSFAGVFAGKKTK